MSIREPANDYIRVSRSRMVPALRGGARVALAKQWRRTLIDRKFLLLNGRKKSCSCPLCFGRYEQVYLPSSAS